MFDNVALDVAIGLIFIYLLYSLLATTVNEFIAMILAYRHRMLEKGIEQMLDGKNYSYYWWDKIINIFRWLLVFVKKKRDKTNNLKFKGLERKAFFRNVQINDQSAFVEGKDKNYIKRNKLNKKASLFANNIIGHPLYRRKSEQSLLFKKPAYLNASAFSDILIDILANRTSTNSAMPVLLSDIKRFVNNNQNIESNQDLRSILNLYIEQANGDLQKFRLLIEIWYDDTMDRVSGWYKRQATKILFLIGFALAITFNINTIEIVHKLSINKDLREAMAKNGTWYMGNANENSNISKTTTNAKQPEQIGIINPSPPKDSLNTKADTAGSSQKERNDSLKNNNNSIADLTAAPKILISNLQKFYKDTLTEVNMMMGLGWDFSKTDLNKEYLLIPNCIKTNFNKVWFVFSETIKHPRNWVGFLITALAITLGAPFWFDLLSKFVNIRAGGKSPAKDSTTSKEAINSRPAINSFG
ncbi:MAG: hypothetical protein V4722_09270 [Bacteroidota bacterium]